MNGTMQGIQGVELIELSDADTNTLCDEMLRYDGFSGWYYGSVRADPDILLTNLLDKPTSRLRYQAGYKPVRNRLMEKYGCDERTLVASLIMSYAVAPQESVGARR